MSLISNFVALGAATLLQSQTVPPQERSEVLTRLTACRAIADGPARLTCYDTAAAALDVAERQGEVVVIDRAQVNETRRQLFGFELPTLPRLFGSEANVAIDSIETTLQSATQTAENRWVFRLADGGVWRQIDGDPMRFQNRPGQPVRVRKAALGSYLMTIGNSRAVRVRRQ